MQSDNACACFVRVGRCRFGSILGSILESFWEPSSLLYSFLVARVAKTGSQKRGNKKKMKTDLTGTHEEMRATGPGALETVKLGDNQTVQLSLQYSALEALHFVLVARWRILMCGALPPTLSKIYTQFAMRFNGVMDEDICYTKPHPRIRQPSLKKSNLVESLESRFPLSGLTREEGNLPCWDSYIAA